jgi:hypothetical protein
MRYASTRLLAVLNSACPDRFQMPTWKVRQSDRKQYRMDCGQEKLPTRNDAGTVETDAALRSEEVRVTTGYGESTTMEREFVSFGSSMSNMSPLFHVDFPMGPDLSLPLSFSQGVGADYKGMDGGGERQG